MGYNLPKAGADEQRVAVPQEEATLNEKLFALERRILAYYQAAGYELLGSQYVDSGLSPELNAQLVSNQELKDHIKLLYTELQDVKESTGLEDRKTLVANLEADLADFEASFVVEVDEAAA